MGPPRRHVDAIPQPVMSLHRRAPANTLDMSCWLLRVPDDGERRYWMDIVSGCYQWSGSVAEWLACWTQAQKGLGSNRSRDAVE